MSNNLLNYRMFGNGHPLVFLHGFLESLSMWDYLSLEKLNRQCILIDLPGHGLSLNEDDGEPSIEYMAQKVIQLLDKLSIREFSVVGHSMGGYVALSLKEAATNALFCKKVVLLNSNFWEDDEQKKRDRLRIADIVFSNKALFIREAIPNLFSDKMKYKTEIEELIQEALSLDNHGISYASLAMRSRTDKRFLLEKAPDDFLIIQGALDAIVPMKKMVETLKGLAIQPKLALQAGHMAHIEMPEKVNEYLNEFLSTGIKE